MPLLDTSTDLQRTLAACPCNRCANHLHRSFIRQLPVLIHVCVVSTTAFTTSVVLIAVVVLYTTKHTEEANTTLFVYLTTLVTVLVAYALLVVGYEFREDMCSDERAAAVRPGRSTDPQTLLTAYLVHVGGDTDTTIDEFYATVSNFEAWRDQKGPHSV